MSTIEQQLRESLLANAGVSALIGTRLYLVQKAQGSAYPCVAYQRISTQRQYHHVLGGNQASTAWSRFQFTIWADGKTGGEVTQQVSAALRAALQTFNLAAQPASPAVLRQAPNFVLNEHMTNEPNPQQPLFKSILDVKIWFQELQ